MVPWYGWIAFVAGIVGLLLLDLLVFHRDPHRIRTKEATIWSIGWIVLGLLFAGVVLLVFGSRPTQNYLAGYLIEKSLSVDNLFVFVIIFNYFQIPPKFQYRVLFYGILGALVFRGIFIAIGAKLLSTFFWVAFVFGAFLLYTAYRIGRQGGIEVEPEHNRALQLLRRFVPVTHELQGQKFIVRRNGGWCATPLLAVLIVIETTDILFAIDSIPAVFGVTRNPFIVFSSNAFAILGLRALYFLLADMVRRFEYLDKGLALILGFVGLKLIYEELVRLHEEGGVPWFPDVLAAELPPWVPLALVAFILAAAISLSVLRRGQRENQKSLEEAGA